MYCLRVFVCAHQRTYARISIHPLPISGIAFFLFAMFLMILHHAIDTCRGNIIKIFPLGIHFLCLFVRLLFVFLLMVELYKLDMQGNGLRSFFFFFFTYTFPRKQ